MAAIQNFRRSISGFNREDVVQYIDYINKKHSTQVNQLKSEIQYQKEEIARLRAKPEVDPALESRLAEAERERAELQQQVASMQAEIAQLKAQLEQAQTTQAQLPSVNELEAYRRAERFERLANERVAQLYSQANAALERATADVAGTAEQVGQITDSVAAQLSQVQAILVQSKQAMQGTADAMKAIRPIDPEQ